MDEYNWDDWDSQAGEYLNSSDYQGEQFETPDGMSWGGQGDPNSQYNFDNVPSMYDSPGQVPFDFGTFNTQSTGNYQSPFTENYGQSFAPTNSSGQMEMPSENMLGNLFSGATGGLNKLLPALTPAIAGQQRGSESQMAPWLKLLGLGGAAMMERRGQQQMSQAAPQAVQQIQKNADPFAAERARYMQELQGSQDRLNSFRQDPNSNAQYAALRDAATHRIDRMGAKQGQRFAPQATNPALIEALTNAQMSIDKQMQADRQGLYQPSGANFGPYTGGLEALMSGNKYGAQADSYSSLFNALGFGANSMQNQQQQSASLEEIKALLAQRGIK
jgi:hypothetical protein